MYAAEKDSPQDILAKLFSGDNSKGNVLTRLEAQNAAAEALRLKTKLDQADEEVEQLKFLIGTNKNHVRFNGHLLDEHRRRIG